MSKRLDLAIKTASALSPDEQLLAALRRAIAFGDLAAGEQVPSIRKLVKDTGLSAAVIRRVYNILIKEGLLVCKQGAGTYVADKPFISAGWFDTQKPSGETMRQDSGAVSRHTAAGSAQVGEAHSEASSAQTSVSLKGEWANHLLQISDQLKSIAPKGKTQADIDLSGDSGVVDEVLQNIWDRQLKQAALALHDVTFSSDPYGLLPLRERIAAWLLLARGIECDANQILILQSPHHARNLIARMLVDHGMRVGIEEPCNPDIRLTYLAYGAELNCIAVDEFGMIDPDYSAVTHRNSQPLAMIHVSSTAQTPTGAVLSSSRRHHLIDYAKRTGAYIIEEAHLSDFNYETRAMPALFSIGSERSVNQVFYIGSFHETFPPSMRVGFLVVPKLMKELALHMRLMLGRFTASLLQINALELSQDRGFDQCTRRIHKRLEEKRRLLLELLENWPANLVSFTPVKGGVHQTIWLNSSIDDTVVQELCSYERVDVTSLSRFYFTPGAVRPGIRLNFSAVPPEHIIEGLNCIKGVLARLYDS